MQFDREKLKAAILYTCTRCPPAQLGAVKLHKVLYFADMLRYAGVGSPITGSTYRKRQHGPTCDQLLATLGELARSNQIEVRKVDYFGYTKTEYRVVAVADTSRLSPDECLLLDEVIEFVCEANTARTISEFSHNRAWEIADFGETLPYFSAFKLFPSELTEEDLAWGRQQGAEVERIKAGSPASLGLEPVGTVPGGLAQSLRRRPAH